MLRTATVCGTTFVLLLGTTVCHGDHPERGRLTAVPFTAVALGDSFWTPRLETNRQKSLPHDFKWCEDTGRIANFAAAGQMIEGVFQGIYFNDSDVYKVLEGASYALTQHPDPDLERTVALVIAKIAAAQQPDGYLDTYFILKEPSERWKDLPNKHELYCAGHLIEAAVAHYRATGRRTFLDVAIRLADGIDRTFGPGKRCDVCGHEEIELALVKLADLTGEARYRELARFFLDARGDASRRTLTGPYFQDHLPVREQKEIVGHAVRAMYLYTGVADMAAYTGDAGYIEAMNSIWQNLTRTKLYLTGGIGARGADEAFGDAYELPNETAYAETCAAIGLVLWSHRMNLLHADAQYVDVLERALYNGVLSGIGMDGEHFFYVNPLASAGSHHRKPFFECACCPTNAVRLLPSLPGYVYAHDGSSIYVNLYVAGSGEIPLGDAKIRIRQVTQYPWEGTVQLVVEPAEPRECSIWLRIPGWCEGARVAVNGRPVALLAIEKGYACLTRTWKAGDRIDLSLPMEIQRIEAHPAVKADRGRVAIQRGPLVYCFEQVDNGPVRPIVLARDPQLRAESQPELLGGVTVIHAVDRTGRLLLAVPYYAWDHREPGQMAVWVWQDGKSRTPSEDDPSWADRLYRPLHLDPSGTSLELTPCDVASASASQCNVSDTVAALDDGIEPKDSGDESIPRCTFWDHRGTSEWVQYDFDLPQKVSAVSVYWFDDERQHHACRAPASWRLLYREGDDWKPVSGASAYGTQRDQYNRVSFEPVTTDALRIELQLQPDYCGGILEWKVE